MSQSHDVTVTDSVSHRLYESHTVVITDSMTCPVTVSASEVLQNVCKPKNAEIRKREKGKGKKGKGKLEIRMVEYFSWGTLSALSKKVNKWNIFGYSEYFE